MKFLLSIIAVSLCVSSVLAGITVRANAGAGESLNIRSSPATGVSIVGAKSNNQEFQVDCQVSGTVISGPSGTTAAWYKVSGMNGYVSAAYVNTNGQGIPQCGGGPFTARVNIRGSDNLNIRSAPTTSSSIVGSLNRDQEFTVDCQKDGDRVSGDSGTTNVWYHVQGRGYVSGAFVNNNGKSAGICADQPAPSGDCSHGLRNPRSCMEAVRWAEAHLTNTYNSEYRGLCDHFVGLCYGRSASGFESAYIHWQTTPDRFKHYDRNPPPGALVFFKTSVFGHATISTGNGGIISTDYPVSGGLGRTTIDYISSHWGPYLGWTAPYFHNA